MDDFIRVVTSDFQYIATRTGFKFNQYSGSVDWENLDASVVDDIIKKADVKSLSTLVASVLSYNIEKMSASKKIFRLSQLIIDFLLHCKKNSTFKFNEKVDSVALCELCGKMFVDVDYLKYHCFRVHKPNSCIYASSHEDTHVCDQMLKLEIDLLQKQLEEINQNNIQSSNTHIEEQDLNDCFAVHKNKLLYHLIPQPGDNPMQVQEMFWKQKYNSLEEKYNNLKYAFEKIQNTSNTTTDLHNKYQQTDICEIDKCSKYVQTISIINDTVCYSSQSFQNINDVTHEHTNIGICSFSTPDINEIYPENHQCGDKDLYELKELRLNAAKMHALHNNTCDDYRYSNALYPSIINEEYVKIQVLLGNVPKQEMLENAHLMDLIELDVKEIINKRLEACYGVLSEEDLCKKNEISCEVSLEDDYKLEEQKSLKSDSDKTSAKKSVTFLKKIKKKAMRFSKVLYPVSNRSNVKTELPKDDPGLSNSNHMNLEIEQSIK